MVDVGLEVEWSVLTGARGAFVHSLHMELERP